MMQNHPFYAADSGKGKTKIKEDAYVLPEALWSLTADLRSHPIIVLKADYLGAANDDLGQQLLAALFDYLLRLQTQPQSIIFYHQAVKLTADCSPVLDKLKALQNKGSELLVCSISAKALKIEPVLGLKVSFSDLVDQMLKSEKVLWF